MEMKEKQMNEVMKRFDILEEKGLLPVVRKDFKNGVLQLSESVGLLYWLNDEQKEIVKQFEEEYGCIVYTATHENTVFGELLDLFYVSKYEEEWEMDKTDLKDGYSCVYCKNLSVDWCSEFGTIGYTVVNGGLARTN